MDEIKAIKKSVYLKEIQCAIVSGEYVLPGDLSIDIIQALEYDRLEEEYFIMANYLREKRSCVG